MANEFFQSALLEMSSQSLYALAPFLILAAGIFLTTLGAAFSIGAVFQGVLLSLALIPAAALFLWELRQPEATAFGASLEITALSRMTGALVCAFAWLSSFFAGVKNDDGERQRPEWAVLLLTTVLGMSLVPCARDLVSFFVYFTTFSVASYLYCSYDTKRLACLEAGSKYVLLGAYSSTFMLLGIALIFGATGSFDYNVIQSFIKAAGSSSSLFTLGAVLLTTGLAFKFSLAPFHTWAPDVYRGAPTAHAAFLAASTKITMASVLAVFWFYLGFSEVVWATNVLKVCAILAIGVGNIAALNQGSVKRILAYSGVANAGYAALALYSGHISSSMLFLAIYGLGFLISFAAVEILTRKLGRAEGSELIVEDLKTASSANIYFPLVLFSIAVFSSAGIPPFPGFFGKYFILKDLWVGGDYASVGWILAGTIVSMGYYLRILVPAYFIESSGTIRISAMKLLSVRGPLISACLACFFMIAALLSFGRIARWMEHVEGFIR